ncbi:homeobox-leucine zipper protein HOX11 [Aegilops tauschii subsp. strangulata]|uniref:homeobox-leucine zipper protein HOX11 n=1 Tax=Aegilops tauschii subsp. strangulata TaxID=200361 RepID=UPI000989D591|nr:homeobox-leucine zipper protein HOX11 [Aegilops tauschii subsp. strangulata]
MELGLSLGEAMADAGRELVLGLGVGPGARREEERRRDQDVDRRGLALGCGSSPEPTMRLALLPMVPSLGFPWPSESRHLEASTRGFDVNQAPSSVGSAWGACAAAATAEEEQEGTAAAARAAVSSSPNDSGGSFPMDFSAQGERGASDAAPGGAGGSRGSDEDDGGSARKKLRLSKEQAAFLEESFKEHSTLNPRQKVALAKQLNLRPRQVEVWFQNRRARTKLKQTEVDCEYLKRCCETLTEENRRLQKELAELRALKTVHPFYMHLPATTLSMCPSCERVASNSAPAPAAGAPGSGAGIASPAAPEQNRPSSFAALFSSARSFPLAAPQPQPPLPAPSSS